MSSGQATRSEFAVAGSFWMWTGMKQGQHKQQHSGQQVKKRALLSESRESNTQVNCQSQWAVLYASRIVYPSNKIVKSLRMTTISTDRAALREALWKSVLLRRVEKVNMHPSHFCPMPPVLLGSVFSTTISKSHWLPTRRQSEWRCLEVWSSMKGRNYFVLQEFPYLIHRTWASISFGATEISPGSKAERRLWQRKQMKKRDLSPDMYYK